MCYIPNAESFWLTKCKIIEIIFMNYISEEKRQEEVLYIFHGNTQIERIILNHFNPFGVMGREPNRRRQGPPLD